MYEEDKIRLYDEDIRDPLFDYLESMYGKIRVFEEKIIGKSRADFIVVCEDKILGIEIKSDVDTYERLKTQVKNYNKYCDYNYIAIGKSHALHVDKHIPKEWGILVLSVHQGAICVEEKRPAQVNPKMKKEHQITMMWRPEIQRILKRNHLPEYKQKSKKFVQQKLLEKMQWNCLKQQMCEELFERDYTLWEAELEQYKRK
ncbi:hypothetical protein M2475_001325 [Breznakia sp. PF5-3]|uniref:MmcB family DNA repair protein n=1 Tax=unclassified Breznakia TaxID=2623764 RepID=UPI002406031F|nr:MULTISPECIES: MmcB family DNA repair protein [unclassified Breznakia]MDF9824793.1 hypothetical protein [Breznakia sp. PM6-1]MDF9835751.1 hypothetical protein [Breznakia sp. PF5-3]MDF9837837.1 hypothetical protein [Breznakia sp. PFB2-8]MDF9859792.1 hypothetical protein [Breznakia sp. PH5-24]